MTGLPIKGRLTGARPLRASAARTHSQPGTPPDAHFAGDVDRPEVVGSDDLPRRTRKTPLLDVGNGQFATGSKMI